MRRRVAVTGIGVVSPIGNSLGEIEGSLRSGQHGIVLMSEWRSIADLRTQVAGRCNLPPAILGLPSGRAQRKFGRVNTLAIAATEQAIVSAGLTTPHVQDRRTGLAFGSTHGSTAELESFCRSLFEKGGLTDLPGSSYLKFMSHTCASTLATQFGIRGRVVPVVSACSSASQSIGVAYEAVRYGLQDRMICGGAEELHFIHAGVFDLLYAASTKYNHTPDSTPRPFDIQRDGVVVAEGAGVLVLEEWEQAQQRGATIIMELLGFGMCCDGTHVTNPSVDGMMHAMSLALEDAKVHPNEIEYINAHGTGTEIGDIAESHATFQVMGAQVPVSSTKGATGHTLGACGAIEAAIGAIALTRGILPGTRNLVSLDPQCAPLNYLRGPAREAKTTLIASNNFAFGGINTSIVLRAPR